MATASLQSPGPGYRILRFSDGSSAWMPPEATTADFASAQQQGEAMLAQKYQAQAAQQNSPVTAGDKVYSATGVYPNNLHGHVVAWVDHHLGGNALNRNPTAQAVNAYAAPAVGAVNRVATQSLDAIPPVGAYDLTATGGNVLKHLATRAAPSLANVPDIPTVVGTARSIAGTPELPANAPAIQRIVEGTASGMNPNQSLLNVAARTTGGYVGGQIGNAVAGEPGQFIGSLAGAGPDAAGNVALRGAKWWLGGEQAPEVAAAGNRIEVRPTFGMVANPTGRRIEKGLGSFPILGGPIQNAQARAGEGIENAQRSVAETLYGSCPTVARWKQPALRVASVDWFGSHHWRASRRSQHHATSTRRAKQLGAPGRPEPAGQHSKCLPGACGLPDPRDDRPGYV